MALSLEDRAAIEDRLGRYVWALDIGDPDAVAACFTADGVGIDTRGRRYEGPGAIRRFAAEFINMPDFRGRQHQVTHLFFDGDAERCVVTSYWTVVKWWVDEDRKGIVSTGWSRDTLIKTGGEWMMTERHLGWFSDKHCPWVGVGATEESIRLADLGRAP